MSYPRPLKEKSIDKMCTEAGLTSEKKDFLHAFFDACASVYGMIGMRDMFTAYRDYSRYRTSVKLHLRDFITYSVIMRRAERNYRVYPYEEVFADGKGEEGDVSNLIIHHDLIMPNPDPFKAVRNLSAHLEENFRYYTDPYFLEYGKGLDGMDEVKELKEFFGELVSSGPVLYQKEKAEKANTHRGAKLKDMPFRPEAEEEAYDLYSRNPEKYSRKLSAMDANTEKADDVLMHEVRAFQRLGFMEELLQIRIEAILESAGVKLSGTEEKKLEALLKAYIDVMPSDRMKGWSPAGVREANKMLEEN